jgi:hypothetical protein
MATLDREHVLDELEILATVEHALIVEYLSICCALGHDLEAGDGGPTTDRCREAAMATAVDQRYAQLAPAVTTHPVFEGELLDEWRTVIVDDGPTHVGALAGLQSALQGVTPAEFLRAARRSDNGSFEQRLLDTNDRTYGWS